jgi:hypothetical protein
MQSIGREQAIALAETNWWESKSQREIAEFQILTVELCCPFAIFHQAMVDTLGRPVWTHEFGLNYNGLLGELFDGKPSPSFQEILDLIPEEKRIVIVKST